MGIEFKIDNAKHSKIAAAFNIKKETVEKLYKHYEDFSPSIRKQYLAHIMRSLEIYFRELLMNKRFIVICEPYKHFTPGQKEASADYFQGSRFVIYFNDGLPDIKKRDFIAHEVGHLFLLAKLDALTKDKRKEMYDGPTEPLSSIFGVFAMSEKNYFYDNYDAAKENHKDWQQILDWFVAIHEGKPF
jgi:hypothetical protein